MKQSRSEWKVGLFVFIALVAFGALLLQFSKGTSVFRSKYELRLKASNIGGLRQRTDVLMSGIKIGRVERARLAPDGKSVTIYVSIFSDYVVHSDARFLIQQSGFLGDQYIAIEPTQNEGRVLKDGDEVAIEEPFDLQQVARNAAGFVKRIDETAKRLNQAIDDIRHLLLNEYTLTNLAMTVDTFRDASTEALETVRGINSFVQTNAAPLSSSASNLVVFSERMNTFGSSLQDLVNTNRDDITLAIQNIRTSTEMLTNLLAEVQSGEGVAGQLIKNPELARSIADLANNLAITTSNINHLGLWRILWRPRQPRSASQTERLQEFPLYSPRHSGNQ